MNYRTKRRRNKRKTKRIKGGTLEYNDRSRVFRGLNNTGIADAYLLNLLGVTLEPMVYKINLLAFYGNPEMKIPGVVRSFRDYYLALNEENRDYVRNLINFIKAERVNDRLLYLAKHPGAPLDGGHVHMYAVASRLKDYINLIDPPSHKIGVVQGTFFSETEKDTFNHAYAGEFELLVGPHVPGIVLKSKFLELINFLGKAKYRREPEDNNGVVQGLTQTLTAAAAAAAAEEAAEAAAAKGATEGLEEGEIEE